MPEELKPETTEEVKPFEELEDKPPEDSGIPNVMLPVSDSIPSIHNQNIVGGLGGKYLALQNEAVSFNTDAVVWTETGIEKTVEVKNRRVLLIFTGSIYCGLSAAQAYLTFSVDDVTKGSTAEGLLWVTLDTNGQRMPVTMSFVTDVLVGSHTFKVELKTDGVEASLESSAYSTFIAIELSN